MGKEIKLNKISLDETVLDLSSHLVTLKEAKEKLSQLNNNMKSQWIGTGGESFGEVSEIMEKKFDKLITELTNRNVELIMENKVMFKEDKLLADGYMK